MNMKRIQERILSIFRRKNEGYTMKNIRSYAVILGLGLVYLQEIPLDMVITIVAFVLLFLVCWKYSKHSEYKKIDSNIAFVDRMTGVEFERYLKHVFEKQGYHVSLTPASNDYGADLILKKGGETIVVQAKRYNSKIGIAAVQEIIGAVSYYKANRGLVVTNSYYSTQAKKLSYMSEIELIDRDDLSKLIKGA